MKTQLSSLDISFLVKELSEKLRGARVDRIYQIGERDLRIDFRAAEKAEMIITPAYICLSKFQHETPEKPSNLAMLLRKALSGGIVIDVQQHRFDRIVEITVEGRGKLVIELFSRGNVILLDENGVIMSIMESQEWKDRTLKPGLPYCYPPETPDIKTMSLNEFAVKLSDRKEIVRIIASNLGLGGIYANEVIERAGLDAEALPEKDSVDRSFNALRNMLESPIDARIILDEDNTDVVPFEMLSYAKEESLKKDSFNDAVDEYFTKIRTASENTGATKDLTTQIKKLNRAIEKQHETIAEMTGAAEIRKDKGDLIYEHFQEIGDILKGIKDAKKEGKKWMAYLQEKGLKVENPADRSFIFKGVEIFVDKSVSKNAALYYEKSKKARSKLEGAQDALRKSEYGLGKVHERKVKTEAKLSEEPVEKKKAEWYEKFRWFISSDGLLVLGGRDAATNEILVKKHVDPNDFVFHSTVHGAPFFVVKNTSGGEIPEATKLEAAQAAASYSSAWNDGFGSSDIYAMKPEQVTKTANSGEYLGRGAFVIRGEREWFKGTELKVAIGFKVDGEIEVIGGPVNAVKKHAKHYVTIGVGTMKSGDLAREVKAIILRSTNKEDGQRIKAVDLGEIQKWIPAGKGMVVKG